MSVLAHRLESAGLATVTLGLVRPTLEKAQPPRSLFVPFELGRPVGEPEDQAFQSRVLRHALGLLDRSDAPVILEDFPDAAPGATDDARWQPPLRAANAGGPRDVAAWRADLDAEIAALRPLWEAARQRRGRSSVGLSGLPAQDWPGWAALFMTGQEPASAAHATPALGLRFLIDDLKAYYAEAAQGPGTAPSSAQLNHWFWRDTVAGGFLLALRTACIDSPSKSIGVVASRFIVPRPYLPESQPPG